METLRIKKLQNKPIKAEEIPAIMDAEDISFTPILQANWANDYPYMPQVAFRMAHDDNAIYIEYSVAEESVRAIASKDNGHVWEDSCCEFFSQPTNDGTYYNIECNCAGTILVGCGNNREGRTLAPQDVLNKIDRWSTLGRMPFDEKIGICKWQLALIIPLKTFFKHDIQSLSGRTIRANFYKCGDALQKPHFLSWNAIKVEKPDFHQPNFFGQLIFE